MCGFILTRFGTKNFDTFKKMGVPGPKPYPLIGTMLPMFTKFSVSFILRVFKLGMRLELKCCND